MAYLECNDSMNAMSVALEADKLFPNDKRAMCISAEVQARKNDEKSQDFARKLFEKAMKIDSNLVEAVSGLVGLLLRQKKLEEASKTTEAALGRNNIDSLHVLLGEVRLAQGRYTDSLHCFQEALVLNSGNDRARLQIVKVEDLLQKNSGADQPVGDVDDDDGGASDDDGL